MVRTACVLVAIYLVTSANLAQAQDPGTFSHSAEEIVLGEEITSGNCSGRRKLTHPLAFYETETRAWEAPAWSPDLPGCVGTTDGATIPKVVRRIVGDPFDSDLLRPAIIHDHYVDRNRWGVRPWIVVTRAFYNALRSAGVERERANVMYYAVYTFGPYWGVEVVQAGSTCRLAPANTCVQAPSWYRDVYEPGSLMSNEAGKAIDTFARSSEASADLTAEDIERLAAAQHPDEVAARTRLLSSRPAVPTSGIATE